jgi:hypothetical protein
MKRLRKLRFRESAVLLIVGGFLGLLFVQQVFVNTTEAQQKAKKFNPVLDQLKGSTKAPADLQGLERGKAPAKTAQRKPPTMKALMDKVSKQPGGKEKVAAAKAGKPDKKILKGSTKAPADLEELKKGKAPAKTAQRKPPTMKALMDKVSKQPGGKEKIKRAKTKGKKSGIGSEMTGILLSGLSELNPLKVNVAHAGSIMTLTPYTPYKKLSDTFHGKLYFYGAFRGYGYDYSSYLKLYSFVSSYYGIDIRKPVVRLDVRVPISGWYMINFETYGGAKAHLRTYLNGSMQTVEGWDSRSTSGSYKDHPALLNLGAGYHSLYWILDGGSPYIYRVTVQKV